MISDDLSEIGISEDDYQRQIGGFVLATNDPFLRHWLVTLYQVRDTTVIAGLEREYGTIAILDRLDIIRAQRRRGHGKRLVAAFRQCAIDAQAQAIILVSDNSGRNGVFNLAAWYERLGFRRIGISPAGPLMLLPLGQECAIL
jgi:GNAT superfamily N-acetyltransferase